MTLGQFGNARTRARANDYSNLIAKCFYLSCNFDLDKIAGMAQVELAKRPIKDLSPSHEKSSEANAVHVTDTRKPTSTLAYRSELKRAVSLVLVILPRATDLDICRRLDGDGSIDLPSALTNAGRDQPFVSAYRDPQRRHRLQVTFSRVRKNVRMPAERRGKRRNKPYLTVQQFERLVELIPEPYATMVYVAIYTGLRVSELAGLRWDDIHEDSITIDERYCRGD